MPAGGTAGDGRPVHSGTAGRRGFRHLPGPRLRGRSGLTGPVGPAARPVLTVATFNIRTAAARDGEHAWRRRRRSCLDTIAALDADVVGLQEVVGTQQRALRRRFGHRQLFGVGRNDGRRRGERASVLIRAVGHGDWELTGISTTWLSPTPGVPGSIGWDAAFPRTLTIVSLRSIASGREVVVADAHFDHAGPRARLESARSVLALAGAAPDTPWALVGDLNAGRDDPPLLAFRDAGWQQAPGGDAPATFHAWRPESQGARIDHVIASPHWRIVEQEVVDRRSGRLPSAVATGALPSDHWPVRAVLSLIG